MTNQSTFQLVGRSINQSASSYQSFTTKNTFVLDISIRTSWLGINSIGAVYKNLEFQQRRKYNIRHVRYDLPSDPTIRNFLIMTCIRINRSITHATDVVLNQFHFCRKFFFRRWDELKIQITGGSWAVKSKLLSSWSTPLLSYAQNRISEVKGPVIVDVQQVYIWRRRARRCVNSSCSAEACVEAPIDTLGFNVLVWPWGNSIFNSILSKKESIIYQNPSLWSAYSLLNGFQ